ncbi:MAG: sulfatase [Acidobacteriales bacterium]|nr:sulfatase [Terriglobales bacterium]
MQRRMFLNAGLATTLHRRARQLQAAAPPNIILILADDLGYGDLSCYGSAIPTPNLDSLAAEGVRFEHYYSTSAVCSPARAGLLTGCYPTRVGVPGVLFPTDTKGLSLAQTTMPQVLKTRNYGSMCIGKWHLGSQLDYLPTRRGFDRFFGVPYSNDMYPPLMRDCDIIDPAPRNDLLTTLFTEQAVNYIHAMAGSPFFLYLAYTAPHLPLGISTRFRGKSGLGPYADCVQELDWSVGQVLRALTDKGIDQDTVVLFTSDNGPWYLGSPGQLRGRKGETYEGGLRMPLLARWPGIFPARRTTQVVATAMDILPTVARLAGAALPSALLDGVDVATLLSGQVETVDRPPFFYFQGWDLQCARLGPWKLHISRKNGYAWAPDPPDGCLNLPLPAPELYNVVSDPGEDYDLAPDRPDIVADIRAKVEAALPTFPPEVHNAWIDTMNRHVETTPAGALPVLRKT